MVNHFRDSLKGPTVAIGHTMGANNLVNLSILHLQLFSAIIIIDPAISPTYRARLIFPARLSVKRRTVWPSRSEATTAFKKSNFYQTWDSRMLNLWTQYGIRKISDEGDKSNLQLQELKKSWHSSVLTNLASRSVYNQLTMKAYWKPSRSTISTIVEKFTRPFIC